MVKSGLAFWRAAIEGRSELDPDAAAHMMALPRFADACREAVSQSLERHQRHHRPSHAILDMSRFMYGYFVLYLDALGGVTLSRIQQLCSELGITSPGRAQAILIHLRAIGYVTRDTRSTNRRDRRYLPSTEMVTTLREAMMGELRALSLIEPEAAGLGERLAEPDFFRAYMIRVGEGAINAVKRRRQDTIQHFSDRNGGLIILFDIIASAQPGDVYPPRGRLRMSVSDLAKRYAVSRSHVFRIFRDAEAAGIITRDPTDSTGTLGETLRADLIRFHLFLFMGQAACCHYALEAERGVEKSAAAR